MLEIAHCEMQFLLTRYNLGGKNIALFTHKTCAEIVAQKTMYEQYREVDVPLHLVGTWHQAIWIKIIL